MREALAMLEPLLERQRTTQGPASVDIVDSLRSIAAARASLGEWDGSLQSFDESIAMARTLLGAENPIVMRYRAERAGVLLQLKNLAAAERELMEASEGLIASGAAYQADALRTLEQLAACQEQMGKGDAANRARETAVCLRGERERGT